MFGYYLLPQFFSQLLPDQNNTAVKQTSPKHNAYPTWTKEFIFAGVDKYDLIHGGVEVLLYDHHKFFSKSLIGGLRLSLPQKVSHDPMYRFSTGGTIPITQPLSRETSPVPSPPQCNTPGPSTASTHLLDISDLGKKRWKQDRECSNTQNIYIIYFFFVFFPMQIVHTCTVCAGWFVWDDNCN